MIELDRPEHYLRSQLPALAALSTVVPCGQAQDLASSLILLLAGDIIADLLTDRGPAPVLLIA